MKINPTKVDKKDLIKMKEFPRKKTNKCAMVTYMGRSVLMPVEYLESGEYRLEFIRQHGIPLPSTKIPNKFEEFFCPNLSLVLE